MDTIKGYDLSLIFFIFQQDNVVHATRSVPQQFRLQEFNHLQWLAHSPNLNPIEHL
jgi:hypothetical protein